MKFSEFKNLSEQLWLLESETPKNEEKISEISQQLKNVSKKLFDYVNYKILYRIDGENFKRAVNAFLTSHNIAIDRLTANENIIVFSTDLFINNWRLIISIPFKKKYPFGADSVYKILKEYKTDTPNETNFLINLKAYDPDLANELYNIIWNVIKDRIKKNKIEVEQQRIKDATDNIELYSSPTLIQMLIDKKLNELSLTDSEINKAEYKIRHDVRLKTNYIRLKNAKAHKETITAEIENLTNAEFIKKLIEQNKQTQKTSLQIVNNLNEEDFDLDLLQN